LFSFLSSETISISIKQTSIPPHVGVCLKLWSIFQCNTSVYHTVFCGLPRRLWCHIRTNGMPFACLTMVKYILRTSVVVVIKMKDVVVCHLVRLSVHSTRAATT
jgi:hypothetical protein